MDNGQPDCTNLSENAAQAPTRAKKSRRNGSGSASLLKAKHLLDDVLRHLGAFAELRADAAALREKVLAAFLDEERKAESAS